METWREAIRNALAEILGHVGIGASIFLLCFGAWVWAQDSVSISDALHQRDIAVLQSEMRSVERRVLAIEDRLFGVFMMAAGAVIGSGVSSIFSIRVHRKLRNGERS